jgi:hypothetical protein
MDADKLIRQTVESVGVTVCAQGYLAKQNTKEQFHVLTIVLES